MTNTRDFVLARLAVAQAQVDGIRELITDTVVICIDPDEDGDGAQRLESIDAAMMGCHSAATALSLARQSMSEMSDEELNTPEPEDEELDGDQGDNDPAAGE